MGSRHVRGPLVFNTHKVVTSGDYTVVDESLVVVNKTAGAATAITLPPSVSADGRRVVRVVDGKGDAATNNITITAAGSDTINGAATYVLSVNYSSAEMVDCGGGVWQVKPQQQSNAATIAAGASGTAGEVDVYPATASKGKVSITTSNNTGNTTTNLNFAAQAAARTITVPDPGSTTAKVLLSAQTQGTNGLFGTPLKLLDFRNTDGSTLAASAAAGKFGASITLGTSFALVGETSNNNTKTDDAILEYVLPATYIAGTNLTVTVNAAISTAGSPTYAAKTVQVLAYRTASDGTQGSDIGPGSASAITVAGADVTFTITGTTLSPGDKVVFKVEGVLHDTGAVNCNILVNSVRVS